MCNSNIAYRNRDSIRATDSLRRAKYTHPFRSIAFKTTMAGNVSRLTARRLTMSGFSGPSWPRLSTNMSDDHHPHAHGRPSCPTRCMATWKFTTNRNPGLSLILNWNQALILWTTNPSPAPPFTDTVQLAHAPLHLLTLIVTAYYHHIAPNALAAVIICAAWSFTRTSLNIGVG
jgi:hypothetical protein